MGTNHTPDALRPGMTLERETPVASLGFAPDHRATEIMREGYSLGYWVDTDWTGRGPLARLFAASPDVLDVLTRLTDKVERANSIQHSGGTVEAEDWSDIYWIAMEARAAIAKARGA